jgi:hypothetical protein
MADRNDIYFAARKPEDTAKIVLEKANKWFNNLDSNGYLDKLRQMWAAYHGAYYSDVNDGHKITFSGEQGEFANLPINHLRNICRHTLIMITATRPTLEARAVNTDYRSQAQTILANGLLDYYMREKRLESYVKRAVEYAIVLGAGYVKMEWNATGGELYDTVDEELDEETGEIVQEGFPIYEGDVEFSNLSPFDVVVDDTKEDQNHDWVLTRSFKNRFDLIAKYPELEKQILRLNTKDEQERYRFSSVSRTETDDITVYEFYHKPSEAMPNGRYILFLDHDIILMDTAMPYDYLPVYRISSADILGSPFGYTEIFDLLPIQDAINSLYTTILSNQNAFGVQNILMPRGTDINPSTLVGGLNLIEYNAQAGGKPEALNLTQTPKEIFDFIKILEGNMETISGISSVTRGNPEASLKSGTALALVQSMSLQYISGLQQSYVQLLEDIGTGLIKMLQKFASVPRIAMIAGKKNRTIMKEFVGDDLNKVNRVIVDLGNPLSRSTAGRVQMAEQLLQMGAITTAEQYFNVINTGELDFMTENVQSELLLIKAENEKLIEGEDVQAVFTEQHSLHIKEHKYILSDPDLKKDPELVMRVAAHIQHHIDLLRTTDPDILAMMGEQPLGPVGGSPVSPQQGQGIDQSQMPPDGLMPPSPQVPAADPMAMTPNLPQPPAPPPPFDTLPTNPQDMPLG